MSLIYRGTSSDDVKFNVTERRVYNAPAFDVTGIEVPGRSGDILNSQERFKNKAIVYTGFIRSSDFPGDTTWERLSRGLRIIKAWICGDAGKYHDLTDDYDPGFVRRAFVSGETAISEILDRPDGATITITFMAEPFMYEESDPIELPETGTASGAIASFEGVAAPLQSLKFSIEPSQDLHGYSYPWPGGGGENVFDPVAWVALGNNSNFYTGNADGTVTVTANDVSSIGTRLMTLSAGDTYVIKAFNGSFTNMRVLNSSGAAIAADPSVASFTVPSDGKIALKFLASSYPASGKVMISKGSTVPASFSPYSNICPISGWSEANVVAAGANLLDTTKTYQQGANQLAIGQNTAIATYGTFLKAGTYKVSVQSSKLASIYVATAETPGGTNIGNTSEERTLTLAKDSNVCVFLYTSSGITAAEVTSYILSPTSTAYAPYSGTPIAVDLGQTVYGGTVDAISGKLTITHAGVKMGDKTWFYDSTYTRMYTSLLDSKIEGTRSQTLLCSAFATYDSGGSIGSVPNNSIYNGGTNQSVYIKTDLYTDPAAFKTAFANDIIVYPLATPIEVDLTPVSVSSLLGQNNIWCNTGDTEVVYVEPTENPTEWPSKPRLEITMSGSGTLTVNGKTWSIGAYTGTLICDSEIMDWYDSSNLKNSLVSGDGFPEFQPGENVITYTGGITKVVAKPRWRTL